MHTGQKAPADCEPASNDTRWKPGQSGNPKGRPVDARNKLSDQFLRDMLADWEAHGAKAIETFRTERPHEYVKAVAAIVPKEFSVKVNEYEDLTDEQLDIQLAAVLALLAADGDFACEGKAAALEADPARALPTLPQAALVP